MGFSILLSGSFIIPCDFILFEENSLIGTILAYSVTSGVLALFMYIIKKVIGDSNMNLTLLIVLIYNTKENQNFN